MHFCCRNIHQDGAEQCVHGGEADPGGPGHDLPVRQALQRNLGSYWLVMFSLYVNLIKILMVTYEVNAH